MYIPCISAVTTVIWLHYRKKKKYNTEVFFFDPSARNDCKTCRSHFNINCPVANCTSVKTKKIILCLQNARKSIDICVFAISNEPIAKEVINAYERGIVIRIIMSNCILFHSKEVKHFQKLGINIKTQSDSQTYMHNKFSIVDSKWLIHGSMNWTHQATFGNWESFLITNVESIVLEFSKGFEKTWQTIS